MGTDILYRLLLVLIGQIYIAADTDNVTLNWNAGSCHHLNVCQCSQKFGILGVSPVLGIFVVSEKRTARVAKARLCLSKSPDVLPRFCAADVDMMTKFDSGGDDIIFIFLPLPKHYGVNTNMY